MDRTGLSGLCVPGNLQRRTEYGDVYRAMVTLGGTTQYCDIEHIALPFPAERERRLRESRGLADGDLLPFYRSLHACVAGGMAVSEAIHAQAPDGVRRAVVKYLHEEVSEREDGGSDLFLLTEPMTRLLDSEAFRDGSVSAGMLARLGIRLSATVRRLSEAGYHIGVLDLDSLCLSRTEDGKNIATVTNLLYARKEGSFYPYPSLLPFNAPRTVREGLAPTERSDTASIAILFTALLNGTYGSAEPDTETLPDHIPAEDAAVFAQARAGEKTAKEFQKLMADLRQHIPDADGVRLPVRTGTLRVPEETGPFRFTDEPEAPVWTEPERRRPFFLRLAALFRRRPEAADPDPPAPAPAEPGDESRINISAKARAMRKVYGPGSGSCEGCCNLRPSSCGIGTVCSAYGDDGTRRCVWDPSGGACGLYGQPFGSLRPVPRTWLDTCGTKEKPPSSDEGEQMTLF